MEQDIIREITDCKRTENALREVTRQLQTLTDSMPAPVARCGRDLRYVWVSKPYADWLGRSAGEIVGRPIVDILGPEAFARLRPYFERVLAGQVVRYEEQVPYQGIGLRWINATYTPTFDAQGACDGWMAVVNDIEDRKRTEQALRASEERFQAFMHNSPARAWLKDAQGRYVFASRAVLSAFGLREQDMIGKTDFEVFPAAMSEHYHQNDLDILARGVPTPYPEVSIHSDGEHHILSVKFLVQDAQGRRYVGGVGLDITQQKRAEQALREREQELHRLNAALREAGRRKDEFLATLAHELRNPLAPIRSAAQVIGARSPDHPDVVWARGVIERQVEQMARLLEDLLDVSRITCNKLVLRRSRVTLAQVVESAIETSRPLIEGGRHELTVTLPAGPVCLDADPVRLAQVFSNLLSNAAKYTERGGRIRLTAEQRGGEVFVSVRDNGIGIAPDMLPRVFEMFAQEKLALERSQGGLGIGLSLVKGLVEMHGGTVEAHSGGPGTGSEFVVKLPAAVVPRAPGQRPGVCEPPRPAGRRIVLADDNRDAADTLAMMLTIMGHEVRTAYDGQAAVEAAEALRPDAVLLDIGMPRLNGYEAARRIREQPWGKDILLVALTGWGQEEDKRQALEAGFSSHMVKPVNPAALETLLCRVRT